MADMGRCKFKPENKSKASEQHQTLLEMAKKRNCAHQKHAKQQNEYYSAFILRFFSESIQM